MISYAAFVLIAGAASLRDASGSITDIVNNTISQCGGECPWGLHHSYAVSYLITTHGTEIDVVHQATTYSVIHLRLVTCYQALISHTQG